MLGIIGLVIGGIWIAASQIAFHSRMNNISQGILQLAQATTRLLQDGNYPQWNTGSIGGIVELANRAGAAPGSWRVESQSFITPDGVVVGMLTQCWGSYPSALCPVLNILVTVDAKAFDAAACTWLLRRFLGMARDNTLIRRIQLGNPTVFYDPPVDATTASCAATTNVLQFMFNPRP